MWMHALRTAIAGIIGCAAALPQAETPRIREALEATILPRQVSAHELREYALSGSCRLPPRAARRSGLPKPSRLRAQLLDVVFHGWPKEWVAAGPRFEEVGTLQGHGYRIRKLRYEIVPGFYSTALLYEPETLARQDARDPQRQRPRRRAGQSRRVQAETVHHDGTCRCPALSLEWLDCGELIPRRIFISMAASSTSPAPTSSGCSTWRCAEGLDYLYEHPNVDRSRIGMTGLSGGGWQTIMLTSLDERVRAAVPVAGFSSTATRSKSTSSAMSET